MTRHALAIRLDNAGDVLLAGPALRAVSAGTDRLTVLCGPNGRAAAELLPGVDHVLEYRAPWIDPDPAPLRAESFGRLVAMLASHRFDEAIVFTSFHQSPLPTCVALRLAGVPRIAAISVDYPGSLLDLRHLVDDDVHEVERALSLARAAGYELPAGDEGRLAVRPVAVRGERHDVVVHPGASVSAREWPASRHRELVQRLVDGGRRVTVTGSPGERDLTAHVVGRSGAVDLGGRTSLPQLASTLAAARVVVCGNTGPAHLAAAVGTPVVSLYAPTVPAVRWRPWGVPHILLGDQSIRCAGCRSRVCPVPGHPCLRSVTTDAVVEAVTRLAPVAPASERRVADPAFVAKGA